MFNKIKDFVLTGKEKAFVSALVAFVGTYLAQSGLTLDQLLNKDGLKALCVALVAHILVYITANTQQ